MENFEKLQSIQNHSHFMGLASTNNSNNIASNSSSSAYCYFTNNNNNINKINIYPPSSISTVPITQFNNNNNNNHNTSQLFDGYSTISNVPTPSNVSMNSNQIVNSLRFNNFNYNNSNNNLINNYNSNYSNSNYSGFASPANATTCKETISFNEPAAAVAVMQMNKYSPPK